MKYKSKLYTSTLALNIFIINNKWLQTIAFNLYASIIYSGLHSYIHTNICVLYGILFPLFFCKSLNLAMPENFQKFQEGKINFASRRHHHFHMQPCTQSLVSLFRTCFVLSAKREYGKIASATLAHLTAV